MDRIIFFDGVCGLCNAFVDFVMARDRGGFFRFATLQGETAAERLGPDRGDLRTVVLIEGPVHYHKSEAALRIIAGLGGAWSAARLMLLLPRGLRDRGYDFVAAHRYRWFGKKDACRMPTAGELARFLP